MARPACLRRSPPRLLVEADAQQLHLELLDFRRLGSRHRRQQPAGRVQRTVGVVAGERFLVRPAVPVAPQLAHEAAPAVLGRLPHQLEERRDVPFGHAPGDSDRRHVSHISLRISRRRTVRAPPSALQALPTPVAMPIFGRRRRKVAAHRVRLHRCALTAPTPSGSRGRRTGRAPPSAASQRPADASVRTPGGCRRRAASQQPAASFRARHRRNNYEPLRRASRHARSLRGMLTLQIGLSFMLHALERQTWKQARQQVRQSFLPRTRRTRIDSSSRSRTSRLTPDPPPRRAPASRGRRADHPRRTGRARVRCPTRAGLSRIRPS